MKTITLLSAIESALNYSRQGLSSTYFIVTDSNDEDIKIRIANHQGLRSNNKGTKTISLITDTIDRGCCFSDSISDEYFIDEDNCPNEEFTSIEEILDWYDIDADTKDYRTVR